MYDTCNWVITMAEKCEQYIHRCEFPHTSACGTQLSHARHINGLVIMGYAAYQHGNTVNPYSKSASTMGLYR